MTLEITLDEQGKVKQLRGTTKAKDIKAKGLVQASQGWFDDEGRLR